MDNAGRQLTVALRDDLDTVELIRALSTAAEYALCDAFRGVAETASYWVDGVELAEVRLVALTCVRAHGFAWCADDRTQWRVPIRLAVDLLDAPALAVRAVTVQLGDAAFSDLRSQPEWKPNHAPYPREWLYALELEQATSGATATGAPPKRSRSF